MRFCRNCWCFFVGLLSVFRRRNRPTTTAPIIIEDGTPSTTAEYGNYYKTAEEIRELLQRVVAQLEKARQQLVSNHPR